MKIGLSLILLATLTGSAYCQKGHQLSASHLSPATKNPVVIEVSTVKLKDGVNPTDFADVDRQVAIYVSSLPGFISRESAPGPNNTWLVIVHWRSIADADAFMKSFSSAPAAAKFMSMIEPSTMSMARYSRQF